MKTADPVIEKINKIKKEIKETPYHKGTEHHIGLLRAKLAKLDAQRFEVRRSGGSKGGFSVRKQGEATVVLVGPPSVGKSMLVNSLTNLSSPVGSYDFTTTEVVPGMMEINSAQIQIFDLPGIIKGAHLGKGDGKQILSVARGADLVLLVSDFEKIGKLTEIITSLERIGFRLNQTPPLIEVKKTLRGGVRVVNPFSGLSAPTIEAVAREFGITNGTIAIKEPIKETNLLIDAFLGNRVYLPAVLVVNKSDLINNELKAFSELKVAGKMERVIISAKTGAGMEGLKELIWEKLGLIRVYLKKDKRMAASRDPVIMRTGDRVADLIQKINSDWIDLYSGALIWGKKAKYMGQKVSLRFSLSDKDVVFLVK